jgi:membrane protein DedA with SNARE-associated domain
MWVSIKYLTSRLLHIIMLIEDLIREYGLWAVFIGVMIEGDLTLLFAGVLAHYGLFSFSEALLTGTIGGFLSDMISYLIGYRGKEWIKNSRFYQRAQPRLEKLSARFGIYSIFLVKYVWGLRTASAVFWGFAHMRLSRFSPFTFASCGLWALILIGSGYFFSGAIGVIIGEVHRIGFLLLLGISIALAVALAFYLIERFVIARRVPEMEPPLLHSHEPAHDVPESAYESLDDEIEEELAQERNDAKAQRR